MCDNVWDLVGDKARSTSCASSKVDTLSNIDLLPEAIEIGSEELSGILDEAARMHSEKRRSKSPAIESLRKMSRFVLEKAHIIHKQFSSDYQLYLSKDVPFIELKTVCVRPLFEVYVRKKTGSSDEVSESELDARRNQEGVLEEKCAYLFRSDQAMVPGVVFADNIERIYSYDPYCPIHGSRRRINRCLRLNDAEKYHLASIDSLATNKPSTVMLFSQAYAAKILRKRKRALLSGFEKMRNEKARRKMKANLWILSVAFLFLFTAFHGLQNLQTSINGKLGADHLCVFYISLSVSSLFIPSFAIDRLGCKITLIVSSAIHMIYMLSNFLPKYHSLIPAAILAGAAASCLWTAKCAFILEIATHYANLNIEARNVVVIRFLGYFFMILNLGQVIGNIISSYILTKAIGNSQPEDRVEETCGYLYQENPSSLSPQAAKNLLPPPLNVYFSLCGVYFCCTFIALMIFVLFLNSLRKDRINRQKKPKVSVEMLFAVAGNLYQPKPLLLIPLTIFNGVEQAFVVALYTKAYVACGLGINKIGFVMTSFGIADAICSLVFGPLIKLFGRMPLFVFGAVINILTIMTLLIWPLNPGDTELFYAIAGVWGMADGVWNTQISGFWLALSGRNLEAAFTRYRFWESLGLAIGILLTRFINIAEFLIVSFIMLLIGTFGYAGVEFYDDFYEFFKKKVNAYKAKQEAKRQEENI